MNFPDPSSLKELASGKARQNKELLKKLKSLNHRELDEAFHVLHEEAFAKMDCLDCANCCKTTSPVFTEKDIQRIAKHLRMRPSEFAEAYLRLDEDEDYVLKTSPCAFLLEDNTCLVYEVRPKACRGYPHTDHVGMRKLLSLTMRNTAVCPAVHVIWERLREMQV
ncbi:MAG: YkgJ family cysteine cluster protein [Bacteroidia bacterium]